jgi:hypothetical protein
MRLLLPFPSPSQTEIHQATSHFIVQTSERKDFPPWKPRRLLTTDPHSLTHKMSKQSAENKCFSRKPDPQMIPDNRVRLIRKGNLGKAAVTPVYARIWKSDELEKQPVPS